MQVSTECTCMLVGYCCYCNTSSIAVVVFPYTGLYANLQLPVMSDAPSAVAHYTAYLVEPCRKIWLQGWSEGNGHEVRDVPGRNIVRR